MQYLIRPQGEISLKSRPVRAKFCALLSRNILAALKTQGIEAKITEFWDHLLLESERTDIAPIIKNIFGITYICPIIAVCKPNLADIFATVPQIFGPLVAGKTFGVRVKSLKKIGQSNSELAKNLGSELYALSAGVDLTNPQVWCHLRIAHDQVLFFIEKIEGAHGLPISSGGRALCLMSGGFDSPVAAWQILKRGIELDFLLCNLAGSEQIADVQRVTKELCSRWAFGYTPKFYVTDFQPLLDNLKSSTGSRYWQVILKRLMYQAGEAIAQKTGAVCLVTGEALGQVSSQTLHNLRAIEDAVKIPILRPLVAWDKEDIIELSRKVGTHDLSASIQEHCSLAKKNLSTQCSVETAQDCHNALDKSLIEQAITNTQNLPIYGPIITQNFYIDHVPQDAVVIDVRSAQAYKAWHYPEAVHLEFEHLLKICQKLPADKTYVIYCPISIQSVVAAEIMQKNGLQAYSFKGGSAALMKLTAAI